MSLVDRVNGMQAQLTQMVQEVRHLSDTVQQLTDTLMVNSNMNQSQIDKAISDVKRERVYSFKGIGGPVGGGTYTSIAPKARPNHCGIVYVNDDSEVPE